MAEVGAMPDPIDWENDDRVMVPRRPAIAIYRNLDRDIVIGLEHPDGEDSVVTVVVDSPTSSSRLYSTSSMDRSLVRELRPG